MSDPFKDISDFLAKNPVPMGPPAPPALPPDQVPVRNPNPTGYDPSKLRNPGEGFGGYFGEAVDAATRAANYGMADALTLGHADEIAGSLGSLQGRGYAEARDAYQNARAEADAASPYSMQISDFATNLGVGAVTSPGLAVQSGIGALRALGDSDALDSQAALNTATGAAIPLVLPAAAGTANAVGRGVGSLRDAVRNAVYSPDAQKVASTIISKVGGAASGATAGGLADAVLPIPGVGSAVGSVVGGAAAKPNALTDKAAENMIGYVRSKIRPPKIQLPTEDLNYALPARAPAVQAEAIPVPSEPAPVWPPPRQPSMQPQEPMNLSMQPLDELAVLPNQQWQNAMPASARPTNPRTGAQVQSLDDFLGPESVMPTGRPAGLGAVPKGALPEPEIGISPNRMIREDYIGAEGPDYFNIQFPKPAPVPADAPVGTLPTIRPQALPDPGFDRQATNIYAPQPAPIPPSVMETPSFAAINAPTNPYVPQAPATAANRMTLRPGEVAPSHPPVGVPPQQQQRQTVPFVERLARAAEVTDNPEVQTTLDRVSQLHAQDPTKAAAYHYVQINQNPAYRETMRIIEGK